MGSIKYKIMFQFKEQNKISNQNKKKLDPTIKIYHLKNKELMISKLFFDILDQFTKCRASNRSLKYEVQN